jgi:hypothetical protein
MTAIKISLENGLIDRGGIYVSPELDIIFCAPVAIYNGVLYRFPADYDFGGGITVDDLHFADVIADVEVEHEN